MITFRSIASGSSGNAYLVQAEDAAPLLLEAGISISKLREALYFGLTGLAGCLVSHEHQDHAKAVKALLKSGSVDCCMSIGTSKALGVEGHHRIKIVQAGQGGGLQGWYILPFHLEHDAEEPLGFLISHGDDRLLFVPDTAYVENRFSGVTILAIEANHASDILSDKIQNKNLPQIIGRRIRRNHFSLENVKEFIMANNMQRTLRAIHLIHLSDLNSNEARFKKEIQELTGVPVYVA